jgi:hypothetical protein
MELLSAVAGIIGIIGFAVGVIKFANRRTHVSVATLTGLLFAYICVVALQRFGLDLVASSISIGGGFVASAKFFHSRSKLGKFIIGLALAIAIFVLGYLGILLYIGLKLMACAFLTFIYFILLGWLVGDSEKVFDDCLDDPLFF